MFDNIESELLTLNGHRITIKDEIKLLQLQAKLADKRYLDVVKYKLPVFLKDNTIPILTRYSVWLSHGHGAAGVWEDQKIPNGAFRNFLLENKADVYGHGYLSWAISDQLKDKFEVDLNDPDTFLLIPEDTQLYITEVLEDLMEININKIEGNINRDGETYRGN